jgi:cytochrome c peroxidase
MRNIFFVLAIFFIIIQACKKDAAVDDNKTPAPGSSSQTPYFISYPETWSKYPILLAANNPMTVEGVALGRKLFYDPILSQNNTMSCATCHNVAFAFTDNGKAFSDGLHGEKGKRNSMPLFNLGWAANYGPINHKFFWDGGAADIATQVVGPITNPIEMNENLFNVVQKLKNHPEYPALFKRAFGKDTITSQLLTFAISQFELTLISGNSKYDKGLKIGFTNFTDEERYGMEVFEAEDGGDCTHCHTLTSSFFTDYQLHNNGTQQVIIDSGFARIVNNPDNMGKFKTPSLRNLVFTSPYMHDGRFTTLEQVIDFYTNDAHLGANVDGLITKQPHPDGLHISSFDKQALIAFLKTLTDSTFINNPDFKAP